MTIVDTPIYGDKITKDGVPTERFHALLSAYENALNNFKLQSYTILTVPDATENERGLIYISDETGGKTVAFSDGVNWLRVQDRAIIS